MGAPTGARTADPRVRVHLEVMERELRWARDSAQLPGIGNRWERQRSLHECYRRVAHVTLLDPVLGATLLADLDRELGAG